MAKKDRYICNIEIIIDLEYFTKIIQAQIIVSAKSQIHALQDVNDMLRDEDFFGLDDRQTPTFIISARRLYERSGTKMSPSRRQPLSKPLYDSQYSIWRVNKNRLPDEDWSMENFHKSYEYYMNWIIKYEGHKNSVDDIPF